MGIDIRDKTQETRNKKKEKRLKTGQSIRSLTANYRLQTATEHCLLVVIRVIRVKKKTLDDRYEIKDFRDSLIL